CFVGSLTDFNSCTINRTHGECKRLQNCLERQVAERRRKFVSDLMGLITKIHSRCKCECSIGRRQWCASRVDSDKQLSNILSIALNKNQWNLVFQDLRSAAFRPLQLQLSESF